MKCAIIYGSAVASFVVEDFSLDRLSALTIDELNGRYDEFKALVNFGENIASCLINQNL